MLLLESGAESELIPCVKKEMLRERIEVTCVLQVKVSVSELIPLLKKGVLDNYVFAEDKQFRSS